ncbi:MAG TPA: glycosyltransferase [Candidatus Humimicrobiaceae bacterium]|nr:glycosyltransferase [Candidatus Humimicrobiaceae bacterium]
MLPLVKTNHQKLEDYKKLIPEELFEEITKLAKDLKGLRVFQVNATPRGGGVAELLESLVPLMKGIGIKAEWYTIPPREDFFKITKEVHNALQGKEYAIPFRHRVRYLEHIERSANLMREMKADIWVIHDPQPAGVILYLPHFHPAICQIHIDLTLPNPEAWKFFAGIFGMYDKIILSSKRFIKKEIKGKTAVFPPAIDPLVPKNQQLDLNFSKEILKSYGIDPLRPLVSQVSRFDPWKGFLGLIEAYQIAKKKISDLQLALVGFFLAKDDPEAMKTYNLVKKKAEKDPSIFFFFDPEMLGSLKVHAFVNAIQIASRVIIQNSSREGFGLSLTEAMWKGKAVIGGPAEGMKLQIQNNKNGFLTSSPQELAKRITQLIKNPQSAEKLGKAAQETVREKFLIPRLLKDYLKVFKELV